MAEITRAPIARVGVDLSKRVYQVHAVDRGGRVVLARPMSVNPDHIPQPPATRCCLKPRPTA
jgi:hypothetical protein